LYSVRCNFAVGRERWLLRVIGHVYCSLAYHLCFYGSSYFNSFFFLYKIGSAKGIEQYHHAPLHIISDPSLIFSCYATNPPSSCLIFFHCWNKHVTWISLYIRDTIQKLASEVRHFSHTSLLISSIGTLSSLHFLVRFAPFSIQLQFLITWNLFELQSLNLPTFFYFLAKKWKINWALIYLTGESTYLWPGVWQTVKRFLLITFNWREPCACLSQISHLFLFCLFDC
jgi:hypothetical protein